MIPKPQSFELSGKLKTLFGAFVAVGLITFIVGLKTGPDRAWSNFLLEYFYWLCLGLSGVFFAALQHITASYWSVTVRRVGEAFIAYLPVAVVLFVVLLFGLHHLYEWTHLNVVEHDPILSMKKGYLNVPFFVIRAILLFAVALGLGGWMIRNSIRQDKSGDPRLTLLNTKISAPFLLLFAVTFTLVAVDLMMSLAPHWFSTIFGVYCWAGLFYSGLAMMAIWVIALRKKGMLAEFVTDDHLHDLGKLMFAFLVFWGYVAFSQYMLIWYANLPEETPYMITRVSGAWKPVSTALMVVKFVIPFFLLVARPAKRRDGWLMFVAFWFLAAQWLDIYWMVFPAHFDKPVFGFMEIGMFLGFAGIFSLCVGGFLKRVSTVAVKDPWLEQCLHHHQ
ncbi:MAG: molybdopterin oxidoreductase [Deltaproteobacteria bacterium]|nr:molybdopterin oxidoreductase [Deltaproteobacteria bacterium]MBI4411904.1 molybdopterin oxidoreductase [Deltaproteobacteria bacterium]